MGLKIIHSPWLQEHGKQCLDNLAVCNGWLMECLNTRIETKLEYTA